jgi:hypothetical protein
MTKNRELDVRGLMDALRVPWKDRGRNCSKGNVNICCPYCKDDYGYHLTVSEELGGLYYCYRRPNDHSGANPLNLVMRLGPNRKEAVRLLNHYQRGRTQLVAEAVKAPQQTALSKQWGFFEQITEQHPNYADYLRSRGFDHPVGLARRYDLRCAAAGKWAGRVLIPFSEGPELVAWTGRAIRKDAELKYYTNQNGHEGLVYLPRPARHTLFVAEGPLDALKGAAATEELPIATAALTGKQLNAERLGRLKRQAAEAQQIVLVLDADTRFAERSRMLAELKGAFLGRVVRSLALPAPFKDLGEMGLRDARNFLQGHAVVTLR